MYLYLRSTIAVHMLLLGTAPSCAVGLSSSHTNIPKHNGGRWTVDGGPNTCVCSSQLFLDFSLPRPPLINNRVRDRTGTLMDPQSRAAVQCECVVVLCVAVGDVGILWGCQNQKGLGQNMNMSCSGDI